jgi:hypothetical protein
MLTQTLRDHGYTELPNGRLGRRRDLERFEGACPDLHYQLSRDQLLCQMGLKTRAEVHPDAAWDEPFSLRHFMYARLRTAGVTPPDINNAKMLYNRAMGSSDFPSFISDIQTIVADASYLNAAESVGALMRTVEVRDFREVSFARRPDLPSLALVPEYAIIPDGKLIDDGAENISVAAHIMDFCITEHVLVNGDQAAITDPPSAAGANAARTEADDYFSVLSANSTMSDGNALFSSAHANDDSSAAAPSAISLDSMRALMGAQTSPGGHSVNVRPDFLLGPPEYESKFAALRQAANTPDPRGLSTGFVTTLTDARLVGATTWYGISDPALFPSITRFVLVGAGVPRIRRIPTPPQGPDGLHFRLTHDYVIAATDWRGICRNAGS